MPNVVELRKVSFLLVLDLLDHLLHLELTNSFVYRLKLLTLLDLVLGVDGISFFLLHNTISDGIDQIFLGPFATGQALKKGGKKGTADLFCILDDVLSLVDKAQPCKHHLDDHEVLSEL